MKKCETCKSVYEEMVKNKELLRKIIDIKDDSIRALSDTIKMLVDNIGQLGETIQVLKNDNIPNVKNIMGGEGEQES